MNVSEVNMRNAQQAASRFFRFYVKQCMKPDTDTLYCLLGVIHSLNDRLKKATGEQFYDFDEFIALKALRNLFHHEDELLSQVKYIPVSANIPIVTDLLMLCMVPKDLVARAVAREKKRENQHRIKQVFKFYDSVVNINPAIFNFAVHAFERFRALEIPIEGKEWELFADSYDYEEREGHSYFIEGEIACRAGDVEAVIKTICANNGTETE